MKFEVNIDKKYFFILLGVLIVIGGIIGVYAVWDTSKTMFHSANDVKVTLSDGDYSLQEAITAGKMVGGSNYVYTKWGDTACATGFTSLYNGYAYQGAYSGYGTSGGIVCSTASRLEIHRLISGGYSWEDGRPCALCAKSESSFCYTKWGDTTCASGFNQVYTGYMFQSALASTGTTGDFICSTGSQVQLYVNPVGATSYTTISSPSCAVCCK